MKTYTLYWRTGKREIVQGDDPAQAMTLRGYSNGAVAALDFYADGENHDYKWDHIKGRWVVDVSNVLSSPQADPTPPGASPKDR